MVIFYVEVGGSVVSLFVDEQNLERGKRDIKARVFNFWLRERKAKFEMNVKAMVFFFLFLKPW